MLKKHLLSASVFAVVMTVSSLAYAEDKDPSEPDRLFEDWEFKLGAGVMYAPDYEGSDDYEAGFMPNVEIIWNDRVSLSFDGLMVDAVQTENLTLGLGVGMTGGRDASDNDALKGLGDVDNSVAGVLYGSYQWEMLEFGAGFEQDLGNGHEGALLGLEANLILPVIEDKFMIMVGPDMTWASDDYMQSYFGISSTQAGNSAYSKYDAGSGVKDVGLHAMAEYKITNAVSLNMITQYTKLVGDAADSPIVKDKGDENQFFTGLMLNYSF